MNLDCCNKPEVPDAINAYSMSEQGLQIKTVHLPRLIHEPVVNMQDSDIHPEKMTVFSF